MRAQVLRNACHKLRLGCQGVGPVHGSEWQPIAAALRVPISAIALQRVPRRHSSDMAATAPTKGKRVGQVIRLRPEKYDE
jgi:hypothetical protein